MFQQYIQLASLLQADDPESFQSPSIDWTSVYFSLSLAVTLLCTIFIVFRIVTLGRANRDAALGGYRLIIEINVESAALLSVIMIIYMATYAQGAYASIYVDAIAANIRVSIRLFQGISFSLLCRELSRLLLLVVSLLDMHVLMMPRREVYSLPCILELATTRKRKLAPSTAMSTTRYLLFRMATLTQTNDWRNRSLQRKEYDLGESSAKAFLS